MMQEVEDEVRRRVEKIKKSSNMDQGRLNKESNRNSPKKAKKTPRVNKAFVAGNGSAEQDQLQEIPCLDLHSPSKNLESISTVKNTSTKGQKQYVDKSSSSKKTSKRGAGADAKQVYSKLNVYISKDNVRISGGNSRIESYESSNRDRSLSQQQVNQSTQNTALTFSIHNNNSPAVKTAKNQNTENMQNGKKIIKSHRVDATEPLEDTQYAKYHTVRDPSDVLGAVEDQLGDLDQTLEKVDEAAAGRRTGHLGGVFELEVPLNHDMVRQEESQDDEIATTPNEPFDATPTHAAPKIHVQGLAGNPNNLSKPKKASKNLSFSEMRMSKKTVQDESKRDISDTPNEIDQHIIQQLEQINRIGPNGEDSLEKFDKFENLPPQTRNSQNRPISAITGLQQDIGQHGQLQVPQTTFQQPFGSSVTINISLIDKIKETVASSCKKASNSEIEKMLMQKLEELAKINARQEVVGAYLGEGQKLGGRAYDSAGPALRKDFGQQRFVGELERVGGDGRGNRGGELYSSSYRDQAGLGEYESAGVPRRGKNVHLEDFEHLQVTAGEGHVGRGQGNNPTNLRSGEQHPGSNTPELTITATQNPEKNYPKTDQNNQKNHQNGDNRGPITPNPSEILAKITPRLLTPEQCAHFYYISRMKQVLLNGFKIIQKAADTGVEYIYEYNERSEQEYLPAHLTTSSDAELETIIKNDRYFNHFHHCLQSVAFILTLEQLPEDDFLDKKVYLPPKIDKNKRTLILDLDETLVHCSEDLKKPSDFQSPIKFTGGEVIEFGITIRPYAREFLKLMSNFFEIVIFTASHSCYANYILNLLDPTHEYITFRLFRESCIEVEEGIFVKDLRIFGNRDLSDLMIVDNACYSYAFQIHNGIPIAPYFNGKNDIELLELAAFLVTVNGKSGLLASLAVAACEGEDLELPENGFLDEFVGSDDLYYKEVVKTVYYMSKKYISRFGEKWGLEGEGCSPETILPRTLDDYFQGSILSDFLKELGQKAPPKIGEIMIRHAQRIEGLGVSGEAERR